MKASYHPAVILACYLNCLPEEIAEQIPRSTLYEWKKKIDASQFGYNWYYNNRKLFTTLQQVCSSKKLLKINKALLRVIALTRFIKKYKDSLKEGRRKVQQTVLHNIQKLSPHFGLFKTLKLIEFPYTQYLKIKNFISCTKSPLTLCYVKHPAQLLAREVTTLKTYCAGAGLLHWPLSSVFHLMRKSKAAYFNISTFYKYVSLLGLKRKALLHRRKNHTIGIRATKPLEILHADITCFKMMDNSKAFIYLVQDNYSRTILQYTVSLKRKASITINNIKAVIENHIMPLNIMHCKLITDDGAENHIAVDEIMNGNSFSLTHLIAQQDIEFSNSMIEAANKQLKYRFLYHKQIPDYTALTIFMQEAVNDFNNRPHHVLNGLTPTEVLNGRQPASVNFAEEIKTAKTKRLIENKKLKCCYSF